VTPTDHFYARYGNPTNTVAEKRIAELEGVGAALTFASGMGAITTTILALLKAGDHIVAQRDIYGGVTKFFTQWLPKLNIETTFVDTKSYEEDDRGDPAEHEVVVSGVADQSHAARCGLESRRGPG
jgi:O-acetylhomoserine/O-acetylserine sulfhydrylase-like pyridoxal-dependent enzyme